MSCVDQIDLCITRGDTWTFDVGLTAAWAEVLENPTSFVGNLVFREFQDDSLTPYLSLQATPEVNPDPAPGEIPIYLRFIADVSQTALLPDWDIVAYTELTDAVYAGLPNTKRLFNSAVEIHD
jgi:hypothetical protein